MEMGNSKSTGFHIVTTFGTKIIVLFGSFIISILLARLLGPEGKGILTAIFIVPNLIVTLADLGVRQASAYYIGRKIYSIEDVFSSSLLLWVITSFFSVAVVLAYYSFNSIEEYGWILILIALSTIPLKILTSYLSGILQGKQRIGTINVKELLIFSVNLIGVILLVWLFDLGVTGAAVVNLIVLITAVIFFFLKVMKVSKVNLSYIKPIPQNIFKKGITFALALFVLTLNYRVDILFLEYFSSATEIGIYSVGANLAELIWQLPAAISLVLFAKSANSTSDADSHGRAARILRMSLPILFFICLIFWFLSRYFVSIIYGNEFQESAEILNILLPGVFIIIISKILHPDMAARGFPLYGLYVFITPLAINILLNTLWIPEYGGHGAAWASTISYSIGGILYGLVYAKKTGIKFLNLIILNKEDVVFFWNSLYSMLKKNKKYR